MRVTRRHVVRRLAALATVIGLALCSTGPTGAQAPSYTPYQHKALFLYNFAKYTEWPKEAFAADDTPFRIGILGTDPFGKDIDIIKGKTVKGRKLEVICLKSLDEAKDCQLLFIASSEVSNLAKILKAVEKTSILTIAENDEAKVMINLVTEKKTGGTQTVAFEINLAAAQKANLKLDAQLLKLAKQVKT